MTQFVAEPGEGGVFKQSFLQQLKSINFPTSGALLLIEVDQGGIGSLVQAIQVAGLPFGTLNMATGGINIPSKAGVVITDKPSTAMMTKLAAWSTNFQLKIQGTGVQSQGIPQSYSAESILVVNLSETESLYPKWNKKFSVTVPGNAGMPGTPTGPQAVIIWYFANGTSPTGPYDPNFPWGAGFGGWVAVIRTDLPETLAPGDFVTNVKQQIAASGGSFTPVVDGATPGDITTRGAAIVSAFANASPPAIPPPANGFTYVGTSTTLPQTFFGVEAFSSMETGIFTTGAARNTYDGNFFNSEGFSWWLPKTYGKLGTPVEALQPPTVTQVTPIQFAFGNLAGYIKNFTVGSGNKTLTMV